MIHYFHIIMKESLGPVLSGAEAWEAVTVDIFEFQGNSYLVVACHFSGYSCQKSEQETITTFVSIFTEHGVPQTIHCDCGTNYMSNNFTSFHKSLNILLTYSSDEHHSSNYDELGV